MKNYRTILCITLSSLILTSCSTEKSRLNEPSETEISTVSTHAVTDTPETEAVTEPSAEPSPEPEPDPYYPSAVILYDLPTMDGSTSAIPLEAGIKAKLMDTSYDRVIHDVHHNKTHVSFQNLLSGKTDLIFSVPISESQQKDADEAGVHLNMVPVAKEAFVFAVNKNNPVSSLTQEQIRDIYSGKITNWSELGGNDEKIIPYQRNKDSGSQNYMEEFMEGYDLPAPLSNNMAGDMGDLMNRIAVYNNASNAIGYSVYSYAAQMYENSDDVKLIAVDGVTPSKETLADGSYPLLSYTYIIHRDNPSEKTERFINWITSEAGQDCVLNCGYLPVEDREFPEYLKLYRAAGTGPDMPENYKPSQKVSYLSGKFRASVEPENSDGETVNFSYSSDPDKSTDISANLSFIKDKEMRETVISDISGFIAEQNKNSYCKHNVDVYGVNGYVSFLIDYNYSTIESKCFTYDFINGKRIENFSDLFYRGTDFTGILNNAAADYMTNGYWTWRSLKCDFLGITDISDFSVWSVKLQKKNPYFEGNDSEYWMAFQRRSFHSMLPSVMVTGRYSNFEKYVEETDLISIENDYLTEWEMRSELMPDSSYSNDRKNFLYSDVYTQSLFHSSEEVDKRNELCSKIYSDLMEKRRVYVNSHYDSLSPPFYDFYHATEFYNLPPVLNKDNRHYCESDYTLNILAGYINSGKQFQSYFSSFFDHHYVGYDSQTGEPLTFADVFGDNFADIDENYRAFTYSIQRSDYYCGFVSFFYCDSYDEYRWNYEPLKIIEIPVYRDKINFNYFTYKNDIAAPLSD